ncbi:MAG: MFS transporter [Tenericutes bacterium]|nr:MFS transporter [Mycoplasmatota bacterium]
MAGILLLLIYIAFISLGLPDSIFGVSWPAIMNDLSLNLEFGGFISFMTTFGTVLSSLFSGYIISKLKTGKVVVFSVFLTAVALLGFSLTNSYFVILLLAFPLGFGAGSIDTALNNYVALHYKPHHMNFLHSFWGVGATLGPLIMSYSLLTNDWHRGYLIIAIIQFVFLAILTISLPLWKKNEKKQDEEKIPLEKTKISKIKGVRYALGIFLIYTALEFSIGMWGSSYLVIKKGLDIALAAKLITVYFLGITGGRFLSGLLSFKLKNRQLIYGGIFIVFIGALLLLVAKSEMLLWISYIIMGVGLAPIFPSMIHDTPRNFGKNNSGYVIGYQIAFAYIGIGVFPTLFGFIFSYISINLYPLIIFIMASILLVLFNLLVLRIKHN